MTLIDKTMAENTIDRDEKETNMQKKVTHGPMCKSYLWWEL
jgi:hypothetical protein